MNFKDIDPKSIDVCIHVHANDKYIYRKQKQNKKAK